MATRRCRTDGCPRDAVNAWYCDACKAKRNPPRPARSTANGAKPSTSQRGLGHDHRRARAQALDDLARREPLPCRYCPEPMYSGMLLDLDHDVARALGGTVADGTALVHRKCNRREGAKLGNKLRRERRAAPQRTVSAPRTSPNGAGCWCGGLCLVHVPICDVADAPCSKTYTDCGRCHLYFETHPHRRPPNAA